MCRGADARTTAAACGVEGGFLLLSMLCSLCSLGGGDAGRAFKGDAGGVPVYVDGWRCGVRFGALFRSTALHFWSGCGPCARGTCGRPNYRVSDFRLGLGAGGRAHCALQAGQQPYLVDPRAVRLHLLQGPGLVS
eukprot:scaffold5664_cov115-Isochrysis_galbana.AAC.19